MRNVLTGSALILALSAGAPGAAAQHAAHGQNGAPAPKAPAGPAPAGTPRAAITGQQPIDTLMRARVRRILGARVFTLDDHLAPDGEQAVLVIDAEALPPAGSTVLAQGVLRRLSDRELAARRGWEDADGPTRELLAARPVLVVTSLRTSAGRQLVADPRLSPAPPRRVAPVTPPSEDPIDARLHPAALGELIHVLGGRRVSLPAAKVIAVVNPRAFLVESPGPLEPIVGNLDRVLVLVEGGALNVTATDLVKSNVRVLGVARTPLGMQVTREVPWPRELTKEMVERLEVRAVVLASSVQTSDGVELIARAQPEPPASR